MSGRDSGGTFSAANIPMNTLAALAAISLVSLALIAVALITKSVVLAIVGGVISFGAVAWAIAKARPGGRGRPDDTLSSDRSSPTL